LPTNASIRWIVSTGSLIVVGFIPSGGRPIGLCVSGAGPISNTIIIDATVYLIYDIVYLYKRCRISMQRRLNAPEPTSWRRFPRAVMQRFAADAEQARNAHEWFDNFTA
jgi:hypothetical protein